MPPKAAHDRDEESIAAAGSPSKKSKNEPAPISPASKEEDYITRHIEKWATMPEEAVRVAAEQRWLKKDGVAITELRVRLANNNFVARVDHLQYDGGLFEWSPAKRVKLGAAASAKREAQEKEMKKEDSGSDSDEEGSCAPDELVHVLIEAGTQRIVVAHGLVICCNEDPDLNPEASIFWARRKRLGWEEWDSSLFVSTKKIDLEAKQREKADEVAKKKAWMESQQKKIVLNHSRKKKSTGSVKAEPVKTELEAAVKSEPGARGPDDIMQDVSAAASSSSSAAAASSSSSSSVVASPILPPELSRIPAPIPFSPTGNAKKYAFIVGNTDYHLTNVSSLRNPVNDANAFAALCENTLGYDRANIQIHLNVKSKAELTSHAQTLNRKLHDGDRVVFFYAGHAGIHKEESQLLCVGGIEGGHRLGKKDCEVSLTEIQTTLTHGCRLWALVYILDACRTEADGRPNNSASTSGEWRLPLATNSLHAFACALRSTSHDGAREEGSNGRFTKWFLAYQRASPAVDLRLILSRTCHAVLHESDGAQQPWQRSSVEHDLFTL